MHEGRRLLAKDEHTVHVIIDLRWGRRIPMGAFNQLQPALNKLPSNLGLILVVGADDIAMTIGRVLKRHHPRAGETVQSVETIEEAYHFIKQHQSAQSS